MNENLDIFIFTHRDFEKKPTNPCYKIVSIEDIEIKSNLEHIVCDKSKENIFEKEHGYSELARIHYIWKNYPLKDYVGTAHYRRYFDFYNDIPNMNEIFTYHDAILPNFSLGWNNIYQNYVCCHSRKDITLILDIICKYYPEYFDSAIETMAYDKFYPCNIFVLKKEMFNEWCEFMFGVLGKFDEINGFKTDNDILQHVIENHVEYTDLKGWPNQKPEYQARIEAFLSERLSTIFFNKKVKNPYMMNMFLTEVHDEYEKEYYNYKEI